MKQFSELELKINFHFPTEKEAFIRFLEDVIKDMKRTEWVIVNGSSADYNWKLK